MKIRFLGAAHLPAYNASGVADFAIPMAVGEVRYVSEAAARKVLADHPTLFAVVDEPAPKVEALAAPEADKQVKAPTRKGR